MNAMPEKKQESLRKEKKSRGRGLKIAAAVCAVLCAGCIAAALILRAGAGLEPKKMSIAAKEDSYCELEVQYIDEKFASAGEVGFYAARGGDGYMYVVAMSERDFERRFADILDYTLAPEGKDIPAAVTLRGTVYKMPDGLFRMAVDYWGDTEASFRNYFGTLYLDATAMPYDLAVFILCGAALAAALGFTAVTVILLVRARRKKKQES